MFLNVFLIIIWSFWFGILCWWIVRLCLWLLSQNIEIDKVGDAFNILGAVTWVIATILVYRTYKTQKEELLLTRQELKNSAEIMSQQKEIMEEENFRNYFSFLLEQKEKMKNSIIYWDDPVHKELRGENFFNVSAGIIFRLIKEFNLSGDEAWTTESASLARYCDYNKQQLKRYQEFSDFIKKESLRNNYFILIYDGTVSEDEKFFFEQFRGFVGKYYLQEQ